MSNKVTNITSDKTRREVLLELLSYFDKPDELQTIVGKDPLLDCALCLFSERSDNLKEILNNVLNTEELTKDIDHVIKHGHLKNLLNERLGGSTL